MGVLGGVLHFLLDFSPLLVAWWGGGVAELEGPEA